MSKWPFGKMNKSDEGEELMGEFYVVLNATGQEAWRGMVQYETEGLAVIAAQERASRYSHEYYVCRAVKFVRVAGPPTEVICLTTGEKI